MDREPTIPSSSNTSSPSAAPSQPNNASPLFKYPLDFISNSESDATPQITEVEMLSENDGNNERVPRSQLKTPRLRQRVFKSLERKADKMINLLTPRKMRTESGPTKLKCIKVRFLNGKNYCNYTSFCL